MKYRTDGWTKSTASQDGDCVEWRFENGDVLVRDSKDPNGGTLNFTAGEWRAFLVGVRAGEADLPT